MKDPSAKPVEQRSPRPFKSGTLWRRMIDQSQLALGQGVLRTIDTVPKFVDDGGVTFVVRVAASLARKEHQRRIQSQQGSGNRNNPFLPPEPALFVGDVSSSHLAVLNKFNVIDHHLLLVTRKFEHQETLLNELDFAALWRCLVEFPGLGFYNGGTVAGASQSHKHLQLAALPLAAARPPIPMEALLPSSAPIGHVGVCDRLPFRHAFVRLGPRPPGSGLLCTLYIEMLKSVGLHAVERDNDVYQSGPYNLLATNRWMLLVPRSDEFFDAVSINGLGYAGSLFVRNHQQAALVERRGPMTILTEVGFPL